MYFAEMFRSCTILKHNSAINISESIEKSGSRYRRPNVNWTSEYMYIFMYTLLFVHLWVFWITFWLAIWMVEVVDFFPYFLIYQYTFCLFWYDFFKIFRTNSYHLKILSKINCKKLFWLISGVTLKQWV